METLQAIRKRASLKEKLSSREVEPEKILSLLNAAGLAPSARNFQPWRFIVIRNRDMIEEVVTRTFAEVNQAIKKAPVLIIACANPADDVSKDGKDYYLHDVGMAVENLLLAATDLGLATHPVSGVNEEALREVLGIPAGIRFVVATPVAYPDGDSYDSAAEARLGQRTRKKPGEIAYLNTWGNILTES